MCGEVLVNGERSKDPKSQVSPEASFAFSEKRYVSRGGTKLEHALTHLDFEVEGRIILDAGASTGGFTDCVLQHGALHVHAVDVGTNQLAYSLRTDPRVTSHEKTNIMGVESFSPKPDVAVADISFRSLRKAAAHILGLTVESSALVLAKPQYEWPKDDEAFRGVVKEPSDIRAALFDLVKDLSIEGVFVCGVAASPITGRKGNREFFLHVRGRESLALEEVNEMIEKAVQAFY